MPKQAGELSKEERDQFEDVDIAGEEGGDTGPAGFIDDGPQAERGDARRDKPTHSGKTRPNQGTKAKNKARSH